MNLLASAREALIRRGFRRAARQLAEADSETLLSGGKDRVLRVFQKAAETVPAYCRLLKQKGVSPAKVTSLEKFGEYVPILEKKSWFGCELREICAGGNLNDIASFYSSSGQTGFFSYGVETRTEQKQGARFLEFALQQAFAALDRKTLLINCLPMGVRVHTRSLALAETSVREDVVLALLRKLGGEFDQFVLLGEHLFIKHLVEAGFEHTNAINWPKLRVHVITGAEYVAENFRSYLASLLGNDPADPNSGMIAVNYGMSEVSVSICNENWHTIQIRRLAHTDPRFREALCGGKCSFCPNVMQYYPTQVYLETHLSDSNREELLVTMLDANRRIPIIRYNTGDHARVMSHEDLARLLRDFGHADLIPPLRLPVVLMWGKCRGLQTSAGSIYPEQTKEAIYAEPHVAKAITGNFRLSKAGDGAELLVQLRKGVQDSEALNDSLSPSLSQYAGVKIESKFLPYDAYPFGLCHDFERKNQYLD